MITNIKFRLIKSERFQALLFLAVVLLVAGVCEFPSSAQGQSSSKSPNQRRGGPPTDGPDAILKERSRDLDLAARQARAFRKGGLKAAAGIGGVAIRNVPVAFPNGGPDTIDQILSDSIFVGSGVVESNTSRLTKDGRDIKLEYKIRVTEVFKGQDPTDELTIVISGGRVSFPDGSWAQVNTPGFVWPLPGREYLWCLRPSTLDRYEQLGRQPNSGFLYEPVHGPLGVFPLTGPFVKPSGAPRTRIAIALMRAQMSRESFLQSVRQAVR